jgi:1,4-alpha-glucan branching enzyme
MSDYTEHGAIPVVDAAVDNPPTEAEVRAVQAEQHPAQARTADGRPGAPQADATTHDTTHDVRFAHPAQVDANEIAVVGDFNDWSLTAHRMARDDAGVWTATVELPAGRYRFRYLIDGDRWENDWSADDYEANDFGGHDSVRIVGPADP